MAISSANAAAAPKVRKVETLNSGTSWTVPAGVDFVNATLVGAGGGGGTSQGYNTSPARAGYPAHGLGGQIVTTTVNTTPGASIAYAIGAGGGSAAAGGSTTFTGATTAAGGQGGTGFDQNGNPGQLGLVAANHGGAGGGSNGGTTGGAGGNGQIVLEYWV